MYHVDLNCDLGESFGRFKLGEQEEILKYVTSANIACGFHSGDPTVMRETVKLAIDNGVKIGAHPGLPDLNGFGRREMAITPQEGYDMVVYQIGALQGFLETFNEEMQHVKPHGALYNMAGKDLAMSLAICKAIRDFDPNIILMALSGSKMLEAAEEVGIPAAYEVFADRAYNEDGSLVARSLPGAVIHDTEECIRRVVQMVKEGTVTAITGKVIPIRCDSICVHGDNASAVEFVKAIRSRLTEDAKGVVSFCGTSCTKPNSSEVLAW